jgi:FKBP-type peptidyl-prolyl cis-trans isomerase 2
MTVSNGKEVSIEYTLTLDDKEVVDSNVGGEPLVLTHGSGQIISGLEKALEGMKVGDIKQVTVAPDDGYGPVNPEAVQEVKKEEVPPEALKVGSELQAKDPNGQVFNLTVVEVKDETVILDFNHPLAGQTLHFDVKILDIQDAG